MQTIGERLEDARKRKGVSIREAAEATKIRGDYLQKFEGNQFDFELAEIYKRGFLRNYALFLKLPPERILDDFESLGRGDARPRQPSREIYGRMDVSISTPEERGESPGASAAAPAVADAGARSGPQLRGPSSLPKAPAIDPQLVFKGGIVVGGLIALLVVVWLVKSILTSPAAAPPRAPAAASAPAAAEPSVTLIAADTVHATVTLQSDGRVLADQMLERGQRLAVPRPGTILIEADNGANLRFEVNGRLLQMPAGSNRVKLESSH